MALDPALPVVVPGELITAQYNNDQRANLDRLDRMRPTQHAAGGIAVSGAFGTAGGTVCNLTVPAHDFAGVVFLSGLLRLDRTVVGDDFRIQLRAAGTTVLAEHILLGGAAVNTVTVIAGSIPMTAGASRAFNIWVVRQTGTGNGTTYADGTANRLDAIWTPT